MSMRQEAAGAASREAEGRRLSGLEAALHIGRQPTTLALALPALLPTRQADSSLFVLILFKLGFCDFITFNFRYSI